MDTLNVNDADTNTNLSSTNKWSVVANKITTSKYIERKYVESI